ncbi:MAG: C10 family peptidase [Bacteroidia bacterium]|nr:C10 family peptidase [Bacteroidia bacterium]
MKTFTTTLLFFLAFLNILPAQEITEVMAATVARNFLYEKYNQYVAPINYAQIGISESLAWQEGNSTLLYIFNMKPSGFVIVPGNQAMTPVLGYDCKHEYHAENQPPNVSYWIGKYAEQVQLANNMQMEPADEVVAQWERYLMDNFYLQDVAPMQSSLGPLLTTLWDQGWPYNYYCPQTSTGGSGGHTWAGCVATAAIQIMYYYRWPDHGNGKKCYIPLSHPEYGPQCADFGSTWYRFSEMVDDPQTINLAIAEYLYHFGVGYEMDYDPAGSAPTEDDSISYFFKILPYEFVERGNFSDSAWISLLRSQLDQFTPLYYAGNPASGAGHAFVCDGYRDSLYFHFNLGWGGTSNGYYTIDNVQGFNYDQEIVIPVFPDTLNYIWPQYLSGDDTLIAMEGSMTDGSGPINDYLNNLHSTWLIDPQTDEDSVSFIKLDVRRLSTADPGDHLVIYDGENTAAPVLADLSGDTIHPLLISSGNKVLVEFITDASGTGQGFLLDYHAELPDYCQSMTSVSDSGCHIFDGSERFHYHNSTTCKWRLEPAGCDSSLTLYFSWFDTEPENDYLEIYDLETQTLLAKYSGHYTEPPAPVTSPSGTMFLIFRTNSSITENGWEAYYGDVTGIGEQEFVRDISIIPNPVTQSARVEYTLIKPTDIRLEIINTLGKMVWQTDVGKQHPGSHTINLDIRHLASGIFLCKLQVGNQSVVKRLVKL